MCDDCRLKFPYRDVMVKPTTEKTVFLVMFKQAGTKVRIVTVTDAKSGPAMHAGWIP